ncbi:hypothetical protein [Microbulbifer sp. THAF38]|uniref:hypothetical protein n=1 Tax=Microbulbifer sp. THAF38 TaxID=2587856 RepID=UPI001267E05B|nr:hypothetical protein [Microbulbifer sp. THAF38]
MSKVAPPYTLFFSISDSKQRAEVRHTNAADFTSAWQTLTADIHQAVWQAKMNPCWLRIDWVNRRSSTTLANLYEILSNTKPGYFRYGLALDQDCKIAFLEQELNGNAMLYEGNCIDHAVLNKRNFKSYCQRRFGDQVELDFADERNVVLLSTEGLFCESHKEPVYLSGAGPNTGRRIINNLNAKLITQLIENASSYLGRQLTSSGHFHSGWYPCFDLEIEGHNNLRHASCAHAMIETWEVSKDPALQAVIERALNVLTSDLIQTIPLKTGETAAFLVESNSEIKLGGNALSLLALVKYSEAMGVRAYADLMEQLAKGIEFMQNQASGQFCHVLDYPSLNIKKQRLAIQFDTEAAFGLIRLYSWDKNPRWLTMVEKALEYFIATEQWRTHDHRLSYCLNELTKYRPKEKYYQLGIRNFANHLGFVENCKTTFPALLELMMSAEKMISHLHSQGLFQELLDQVNLEHFYRVLAKRADHLLNGYFWPEFAMFFKNPEKITGGFFIRHKGFRLRADEVEQYLSGLIAYRNFLLDQTLQKPACIDNPPQTEKANHIDNIMFSTP